MSDTLLSTRTFSLADQLSFATISGDVNPMHLDAVAARRTQAGEPVVHGMHALLWALDTGCRAGLDVRLETIKVAFERFVPLNVPVTLWRVEGRLCKLVLRTAKARLVTIALNPPIRVLLGSEDMNLRTAPRELPLSPLTPRAAEAAGMAGVLQSRPAASDYPTLAADIGSGAIDAMATLSALIGMVVPGLHSILSAIELRFDASTAPPGVLCYRVRHVSDVFGLADTEFAAAGVAGTIKAFFRPPPTRQDSIADLGRLIEPGEFGGMNALVIGGSRGIGEVAAKLLAAGGADVVISYATGKEDAEILVEDIRSHGGRCRAIRIDAFETVAPQIIRSLTFIPSHILYFATPRIASQRDLLFDAEAFQRFSRIYVAAFAELCTYAASLERRVTLFYPSSSYLDDRPQGMAEYAMAKSAGEILCADVARFGPRLRVITARLPRMLTDQTAAVSFVETTPIAPLLLSILRSFDAA